MLARMNENDERKVEEKANKMEAIKKSKRITGILEFMDNKKQSDFVNMFNQGPKPGMRSSSYSNWLLLEQDKKILLKNIPMKKFDKDEVIIPPEISFDMNRVSFLSDQTVRTEETKYWSAHSVLNE